MPDSITFVAARESRLLRLSAIWRADRHLRFGLREAAPHRAARATPAEGDGPHADRVGGASSIPRLRWVSSRVECIPKHLLLCHQAMACIAAVEGASEEVLATYVQSAGGRSGSLAAVFRALAVGHVLGHTRDNVGASSSELGGARRSARSSVTVPSHHVSDARIRTHSGSPAPSA